MLLLTIDQGLRDRPLSALLIFVVLVLVPLWANYLVKAYSWRTILSDGGIINWALEPLGLSFDGYSTVGLWLVFTYLWLPFMILPVYAGLERIPSSLLEASADLGGRSLTTFFRVILPLAFPAVVAGDEQRQEQVPRRLAEQADREIFVAPPALLVEPLSHGAQRLAGFDRIGIGKDGETRRGLADYRQRGFQSC